MNKNNARRAENHINNMYWLIDNGGIADADICKFQDSDCSKDARIIRNQDGTIDVEIQVRENTDSPWEGVYVHGTTNTPPEQP